MCNIPIPASLTAAAGAIAEASPWAGFATATMTAETTRTRKSVWTTDTEGGAQGSGGVGTRGGTEELDPPLLCWQHWGTSQGGWRHRRAHLLLPGLPGWRLLRARVPPGATLDGEAAEPAWGLDTLLLRQGLGTPLPQGQGQGTLRHRVQGQATHHQGLLLVVDTGHREALDPPQGGDEEEWKKNLHILFCLLID